MNKDCIDEVIRFLKKDGIVFRHSSDLTSKVLINGKNSRQLCEIAESTLGEKVNSYCQYYKDNAETYVCLICTEIFKYVLIAGNTIMVDGDLSISEDILVVEGDSKYQINLNEIYAIEDTLNKRYNY